MSKLDSGRPPGTCANCGRPFLIPPSALTKRFCSDRCRDEWHLARRRRATELLREQEQRAQDTIDFFNLNTGD